MFTVNQQQTMLKTTLITIANSLLSTNNTLTTKELKDEVHRLGANAHWPNGEFTQIMASNFLNEFYAENDGELNRGLKFLGNISYWEYSKTQPTAPLPTQAVTSSKPAVFDIANGSIVCYNKNNPAEFVQADLRKTARTAVRKKYSITNANDINTCSAQYYQRTIVDRTHKKR